MALKLNNKFVENYVSNEEIAVISSEIYEAQKVLNSRTGEGNDFLGWVERRV